MRREYVFICSHSLMEKLVTIGHHHFYHGFYNTLDIFSPKIKMLSQQYLKIGKVRSVSHTARLVLKV